MRHSFRERTPRAPLYSGLSGTQTIILSSFSSSSSFTVKLNLKFLFLCQIKPQYLAIFHELNWLLPIPLGHTEKPWRTHLSHRQHLTLCLSITTFVSCSSFLKIPANMSYRHKTAFSRQIYNEKYGWKTCTLWLLILIFSYIFLQLTVTSTTVFHLFWADFTGCAGRHGSRGAERDWNQRLRSQTQTHQGHREAAGRPARSGNTDTHILEGA